MELTFIVDPGHGWLKVPRKIVDETGFTPSHFSFIDHHFYYLEEDCDATEFLNKLDESPNFIERHVENFQTHCMQNGIKRVIS